MDLGIRPLPRTGNAEIHRVKDRSWRHPRAADRSLPTRTNARFWLRTRQASNRSATPGSYVSGDEDPGPPWPKYFQSRISRALHTANPASTAAAINSSGANCANLFVYCFESDALNARNAPACASSFNKGHAHNMADGQCRFETYQDCLVPPRPRMRQGMPVRTTREQ